MKARFFCDHCGKEVLLYRSTCPSCGRSFQAVQCPRCEFKGEPELFTAGCPACGYLSSRRVEQGKKEAARDQERSSQVPAWLFRALGIILLITIIFLLYLFFKL